MDVKLARPGFLSIDSLLALLALSLVGIGTYRVLTDVGTQGGIVGWILIALGWLMVFPRMFLSLELTPEAVEANLVTGSRSVPYETILDARKVDGLLSLRWGGVKASAYHAGPFHLSGFGRVRAFASKASGPFVLLDREGEEPVVVSPDDPEEFLRELESRQGKATGR